jgi:hypothetical protein
VTTTNCHRLLHSNTTREEDDDKNVSLSSSQVSFQVEKNKEGDNIVVAFFVTTH